MSYLAEKKTPLNKCTGHHDDVYTSVYYTFKKRHGEKLEEEARKQFGIVPNFRSLTWGNFEHLLCEWRKFITFENPGRLETLPAHVTSGTYHELLAFRC